MLAYVPTPIFSDAISQRQINAFANKSRTRRSNSIRYDLQDGSLFSSSEFFFVKFVNFISLKEFFEVSKWWFGSSKFGDRFFLVFFYPIGILKGLI